MPAPARSTPLLTPAAFHILLALTEHDRHGLGIADEVENLSGGDVELGPGTLYRSLKDMTVRGLVREVGAPAADHDPRRKYYRITAAGRSALTAQAARYERIAALARRRRVLPGARP